MFALTAHQFATAADDLRIGISGWRLSHLLAWQEIKQRYRRSTLGPIWLTLSYGVQMLAMGILGSWLLKIPVEKYMPYVCAGMSTWGLIVTTVNDGGMLFVSAGSYLTQVKRPYTIYLVQTVWRNVILFAHNFVVYILIAIYFLVKPSISIFLWPLALLLVLISLGWMSLVIGIISARYRDVPMIVQSMFAVLFWVTPLMYMPEQLGDKAYIIDYNPFTHMVALVRTPLLGGIPTLNDWLTVAAFGVVGWIGTFLFFARFRARIIYWL